MEKQVLDAYKQAGRIAREALEHGKKLIKPGEKLLTVCDSVDEFILSKGGLIAFPSQISVNNIAAHYCPDQDDPTIFKEGDLAKIDVGVHINGYVGDNACTIDLGDHKELVKASQEALISALRLAKPGITLSELGSAIQQAIQKYGLSPIKNLSGHGLGRFEIHTSPSIPNFDTGDQTELEEGMAIAIEPFATNGKGSIYESSNATIFSQHLSKPVRSPFAREILRHIEQYNNLPFAKRWLTRKFGIGKTSFGLKELIKLDIVKEHPPLPEKGKGLVSQAEHTVIIREKPIITTQGDE